MPGILSRIASRRTAGPLALAAGLMLSAAAGADPVTVAAGSDLQRIIDAAAPGTQLQLQTGQYAGNLVIDKTLTLTGPSDRSAIITGDGKGRSIWVKAPEVTLEQLTVRGSGMRLFDMDAAIFLDRNAHHAVVRHNDILDNLIGVYVWGPQAARVLENRIVGDGQLRRAERGNGIQLWNTPGTQVVGNDVRAGRDGIFVNASRENSFRDNHFQDVRFGVHYMYTEDSEVTGNTVIGADAGYALMFSNRLRVIGNVARGNRDHGLLLNAVNASEIHANRIEGSEKCVFIYAANINRFTDNLFEHCRIGVHYTAGSERNHISNNAFIDNQTQVRYVGTRELEWSDQGRGNYWSDNTAFDLDGDGIGDMAYRPNGIMDEVLWRAPMARLLVNSPATQVIKWAQAQFPAIHPGGVIDSAPLMSPPAFAQNRENRGQP